MNQRGVNYSNSNVRQGLTSNEQGTENAANYHSNDNELSTEVNNEENGVGNSQLPVNNNSEIQQMELRHSGSQQCDGSTCQANFKAQIKKYFRHLNFEICVTCNDTFKQNLQHFFRDPRSERDLCNRCKESCKTQLQEFLRYSHPEVCNNCNDNFTKNVQEYFVFNECKQELKEFYALNREICHTCKKLSANSNELDKHLNCLYKNEKERRYLWKDSLLNWEITEGPKYVIEDGVQYSYLKINRSAKCKTQNQLSLPQREQTSPTNQQAAVLNEESSRTRQQTLSTNQQSLPTNQQSSSINYLSEPRNQQTSLTNQQSLPVNQQSTPTNQQPEVLREQSSLSNQQTSSSGQPALLVDQQTSSQNRHSLLINQQPVSVISPNISGNYFFPLKFEDDKPIIEPLTHISLRKTCCLCCCPSYRHQSDCWRLFFHCYHYSHHAVILHRNENTDDYHVIESSGRPYFACCKTMCSDKKVREIIPNPCCLCPCKCYTSNAVKNLSNEDFDVVIYRQSVDSIETLQTLIKNVNNEECCRCVRYNCNSRVFQPCEYCYFEECAGYCLCINNCEHQAVKSKIGIAQSHQVKDMVDKCCLHLTQMMHIYFLRFMLLISVLLNIIDSDTNISLAVDILIHAASFVAVLISQLASLRKNIQEQRRLKNEVMSFTKAKYFNIFAVRIILFLLYSVAAIGNNLINYYSFYFIIPSYQI